MVTRHDILFARGRWSIWEVHLTCSGCRAAPSCTRRAHSRPLLLGEWAWPCGLLKEDCSGGAGAAGEAAADGWRSSARR